MFLTIMIALSHALQTSLVQHYAEFRHECASIFTSATARKILQAWSKVPNKLLELKRKKKMRQISQRFHHWLAKALFKQSTKSKINDFNKKKRTELKKVLLLLYRNIK